MFNKIYRHPFKVMTQVIFLTEFYLCLNHLLNFLSFLTKLKKVTYFKRVVIWN